MVSLFLDSLAAINKGRPPIWLMRQAGRYMPSYLALRARYGSDLLFHESDLISTITLLPVDELGVDAAILFSDILMVLETFGISWKLIDGVGPIIENKTSSLLTLQKKEVAPIFEPLQTAIKHLKATLKVPLIGFAGGPFTLACYLIEGKPPGNREKVMKWLSHDPDSFKKLLSILSDAIADWLSLQMEAGVDAIQIFDTLAGELDQDHFEKFALPFIRFILKKIDPKTPRILFSRKSASFVSNLPSLPCQGISLDDSAPMASFRRQIPLPIALQGNLNPALLLESKEVIEEEVKELLASMRGDPAFIVNISNGLTPSIPYDRVKYLVDLVKSYEP